MTARAADRLQYGQSPAGDPIAEYELEPGDQNLLPTLAGAARRHGARRLCVYSTADLSAVGFVACEGYRRFTASAVPIGSPLPVLDPATVAVVWPKAFVGQWGHHLVRPADYDAVPARFMSGCPREMTGSGCAAPSPAEDTLMALASPVGWAVCRRRKR
ncbi:MAG TPA: hypothetical protein VMA72_26975 [Streptosporangiaceae bacterium]|nr:hypothetical protein [Streptosporangiaceae bacterium]